MSSSGRLLAWSFDSAQGGPERFGGAACGERERAAAGAAGDAVFAAKL
jgi:hypothetical protein